MTEHARRSDDKFLGKLINLWPIIVAFLLLGASYIRNEQKLKDTADLAKETAIEVTVVQKDMAVQKQIIEDIREEQREMRDDVKKILRLVK